jgi:hypothetical protein
MYFLHLVLFPHRYARTRHLRLLTACTALILLVACGSPGNEHREFTFTPVPYVTIADEPSGTLALALKPCG